PIEVKISESDIKDNKLTFLLTASKQIQPKDIRVTLEGYDEKGQTTAFSKNIIEFKRLGKQKVFQPMSIEISPFSLYVKLVLYYKNLITEDFFLKNIEYKSEEILSHAAEIVSQESVLGRKKAIQVLYDKALKAKKAFDKGRVLEEAISKLIELVPNLKVVRSRVYDGVHEVDLLVRNFNREGVWADFEGIIFVECKNWSKPVGSSEIDSFYAKLRNKHIKSGLFISIKGITGKKMEDARGQIRLCLHDGYNIIIVNGKDIKEILNCKDVSAKMDEKYIELYT
ncbi:MAG: restriction endonuclease, partial [Nitrososphaeraceae archaeon]